MEWILFNKMLHEHHIGFPQEKFTTYVNFRHEFDMNLVCKSKILF